MSNEVTTPAAEAITLSDKVMAPQLGGQASDAPVENLDRAEVDAELERLRNLHAANVETREDRDAADQARIAKELASVRSDIGGQQARYKAARGTSALALMVAQAFVTTDFILTNVDEEVQAIVLSQHQIDFGRAGTSRFTPWLMTSWGEEDPLAEKVKAIDGQLYAKWMPDTGMAFYFHACEALSEAGYSHQNTVDEVAAYLVSKGGASTVANKRKSDKAKDAKKAREPEAKEERNVYLLDGPALRLDVAPAALGLPEETGRYFTALLERDDFGNIVFRGVAATKAESVLQKLAKDAYPGFKAEREKQAAINEGVKKALEEKQKAAKSPSPKRVSPKALADFQASVEAKAKTGEHEG